MMKSSLRILVTALIVAAAASCSKSDAAPQSPPLAAGNPPADTLLEHIDRARIMGSPDAKVWLVEASDFQCPFCKQFHDETYGKILKEYVEPGKVRLAFLNHPMDFHQFAIPAAEAAMCAGAQDKFWQMHDALFATQEKWTKGGDPQPIFDSLATSLKIDLAPWKACITSHKTVPMINGDDVRTRQGGVQGTPSFFVANKLAVVGAQPYAAFKASLDSALAGGATPTPAAENAKKP